VADKEFEGNRKHVMWLCLCDCGQETTTYGAYIRNGDTKSCGCLLHENKGRKRLNTPLYNLMKAYRGGATLRNLPFKLIEAEFELLISSDCHYCGQKPSKRVAYIGDLTWNGVDRVDNKKGYTLDNAVACCEDCNMMKGGMGYIEFTSWLMRAGKHLLEKFSGK
jgi:5-methylcytosine-specific restriction endonuclease McrA